MRLLPKASAELARAAPVALAARVLAALAVGAAPVAVAWLTRQAIDRLTEHQVSAAEVPLIALCLFGAAAATAQYLGVYADRELGRRTAQHALGRLFGAVVAPVGVAELEDPGFQDRLRLAQQAATGGNALLAQQFIGGAQSAVTFVGFLVALLPVSPLSAALVLASAVPAVVAQARLSERRVQVQSQVSPQLRRQVFYSSLMLDPRAAAEIRLFGLGPLFRGRMVSELTRSQQQERTVDRATLRVDSLLALLTGAVSAAALLVTAARVGQGREPVGDLVLLMAALAGVQGALAGLVSQIGGVGPALALYGHYDAVVGARPVPGPAPEPSTAGGMPGPLHTGIQLRDVWFRYHSDQEWVLRGVTLSLPAEGSVALVGLNGAGKSTLVKLLCRLYDPQLGSITWDGVDLRELDPAALRRRIGVLFQDYTTYALTVAENIAVGEVSTLPGAERPDTDGGARVRAAAAAAGVDTLVAGLPDGYGTMLSRTFAATSTAARRQERRGGQPVAHPGAGPDVGRTGVALSGGQWQRIALARALLRRDADLLILDEPSSGLDAEAEQQVHARLVELRARRTSLLISHRLSSVRQADRIVVLRGGRIIEQGDHDSLMRSGGAYAELFRTQAAGYQLAAAEPSGGAGR
ncbi:MULTISPECIES: ABC transporter ATP-binding protein [Streptacidiphilus]|uniref:ABC transporter ATP-binding protein n=1 Tax=Streptacidiphilus cavernicola TaxID=3342716 RepID=A0ABV6UNJ2_9ACTN|nr:ABC transporter ATP-binding protein [Streptacidiphilus jeojiense]